MLMGAGSSWLQMRWERITNLLLPVTAYQLEYRLTFEPMWTALGEDVILGNFNISGLYPNANYQVSIIGPSHDIMTSDLFLRFVFEPNLLEALETFRNQ